MPAKAGSCPFEARGFSPVELVVRLLRRRLGPVPLTARLDTLTAGQFDDLGEALLDFRTIADSQQWLD